LLLGWADVLYTSGEKGVRFLPRRAAVAVRTARHVYADIGNVIAARGCDPFAPRAIVSTRRKLSLGARAFAQTLAESRPAFRRVNIDDVLGVTDVLCV
jgi:phytoene synthase